MTVRVSPTSERSYRSGIARRKTTSLRVGSGSWFTRHRRRHNRRLARHKMAENAKTTTPGASKQRLRFRLSALLTGVLWSLQVALCVALVGGTGWAGFAAYRHASKTEFFTIKRIDLDGYQRASEQELLQRARSALGQSILGVDVRQLTEVIESHPWVAKATVYRNLPGTLRIRIAEQTPKALALIGELYLVNDAGAVFKRASFDETENLPIITGIEHAAFLNDEAKAQNQIKQALAALALYRQKDRPAVGEINVSRGDVTLFLRENGTALRFGAHLSTDRLHKFDAVLQALGSDAAHARAVFLDHESRPERVVVRMPDGR